METNGQRGETNRIKGREKLGEGVSVVSRKCYFVNTQVSALAAEGVNDVKS